jgi:lysozyme family protein
VANFEPIVEWLLYQEDDKQVPARVVNLGDGAGLTRLGITSKNFGTLPLLANPNFWDASACTTFLAINRAKIFYDEEFWRHINGDRITDDQIAALVLSWSVNRNIPTAVKALQRVLGVDPDGVLGGVTLAELSQKDPKIVAAQYRAEWISFYHGLVDLNPSNQRFLDGWINRANFPYPSPLPAIYH